MITWDELVTTALLGTDRRPLPVQPAPAIGADPPSLVLDLASQHRAVAQAGAPLRGCPAPPVAPAERLPTAPPAAQELLAGLLLRPEPGLVNDWMTVCADRGLGVAADLWPRLAGVAGRNTAYDRQLLLRVLGPRGRWLLQQNPQWARLVDPSPAAGPAQGDPAAALAAAEHGEPADRALELLLACPDPWSPDLAVAALRLVAGGELGAGTREGAMAVGLRLPLDVAFPAMEGDEPADWSDELAPGGARLAASTLRVVQLSLVLLQRTVQARVQIRQAFDASQATEETGP